MTSVTTAADAKAQQGPAWLAWAALILVLGATLSPLARAPSSDGFPLSTYPMFTAKRTRADLYMAFRVDAGGQGVKLSAAEISGDGEEPMAAASLLRRARRDKSVRRVTCEEIAQRLRAQSPESDPSVAVELVVERWDPVGYYTATGPVSASSRKVFARCRITSSRAADAERELGPENGGPKP